MKDKKVRETVRVDDIATIAYFAKLKNVTRQNVYFLIRQGHLEILPAKGTRTLVVISSYIPKECRAYTKKSKQTTS